MSAKLHPEAVHEPQPPEIAEDAPNEKTAEHEPIRFFAPGFWETYLRCFFLVAVMVGVGFVAYRPSVLRFSILLSLARPSHTGSLMWRADEDSAEAPRPVIRLLAPAEWRLNPGFDAQAYNARRAAKRIDLKPLSAGARNWRRLSYNPWSWQNDTTPAHSADRGRDDLQPIQKPATAFRAKEGDVWTVRQEPAQSIFGNGNGTGNGNGGFGALSDLPQLPNLSGQVEFPAFGQPTITPAQPSQSPFEMPPPLQPLFNGETSTLLSPEPQTPKSEPAAEAVATVPATATATASGADLASREIGAVLPDSYLTIYPKLNFIGLCVPGQGYIRKYNQVGVPQDQEQPKQSGQDGRTPYGRYYVTGKSLGPDGPVITLSWPSPEDAKRIGLPQAEQTQIETAWDRKEIPPQTTAAGGNLGISYGNTLNATQGGFTLELPQLEELYTALPVGAWVFVQP